MECNYFSSRLICSNMSRSTQVCLVSMWSIIHTFSFYLVQRFEWQSLPVLTCDSCLGYIGFLHIFSPHILCIFMNITEVFLQDFPCFCGQSFHCVQRKSHYTNRNCKPLHK